MLIGRELSPADGVDGQKPQPVCVIGWRFWRRHFNGDPTALGQTLELDHKKYTIVGVAPPRFTWYSEDVYVPLKLTSEPGPVYIVMPLLKLGVTKEQANRALQPVMEEFAQQTPKRFPQHFRVQVKGLNDWVVESLGGTLYLLLGAVALLLAIGRGNVSILLLAPGDGAGARAGGASGRGRGAEEDCAATAYRSAGACGDRCGARGGARVRAGEAGFVDSAEVPVRAGSADRHQCAGAVVQRRSGAEHGDSVRAMAGVEDVAARD